MDRTRRLLAASLCLLAPAAWAISLDDVSKADAGKGLKGALEQGALAAVAKLGVDNGFLNNEKVKIGLPHALEKARPLFRLAGRERQLDELVVAMNHAAETAVPMAKPLLLGAIKNIGVGDAKAILIGGETSVTDFFRDKTAAPLSAKFLPIVKGVTARADLANKFNSVLAQAAKLGLTHDATTVEAYVTERALAALFALIGEEEKAIRSDPLGSTSKIVAKVFGALR